MDEHCCFSGIRIFQLIEEKDPKVDEERVPHHDEGEGGPHDVAVPKKVEEGEKVGSDIREWQNCVK